MIVTILISLVLIFAALKLGAVGVLAYNLIRLFVGSLAYLAILATFFYLYAFKWLDKHEGVISGFLSFFAGVLLMFQAFFVSSLHLDIWDQGHLFKNHGRLDSSAGGEFCWWWYDRCPFFMLRFPSCFQILALILLAFSLSDWGSS